MPVWLQFALVVEEDWPPVGSESLPFEKVAHGYKCCSVPLFVKGLSVDDVIGIEKYSEGFVYEWNHVQRSERTTIWLARLADHPPIEDCLRNLRLLECNTASAEQLGCYAVDVPASLPIAEVDAWLEALDPEFVAIAFPSMRHPE